MSQPVLFDPGVHVMGGGLGALFSSASFLLDFSYGDITSRGTAAAPTFTRATTATVTDQDSIVRACLSGEARFQGLRRVRNWLTAPEAPASWIAQNGGTGTVPTVTASFASIAAPDGSFTAARIQASIPGGSASNANFSFFRIPGAASTGTGLMSVWLRSTSGTPNYIYFRGDTTSYLQKLDGTWRRYTVPAAAANGLFDLGCRGGALTAAFGGSTIPDETVDFLVWHPQHETVESQAVPNPAEYLSVGVLSAPYFGANVDGVRYFPWHNANVVQQNLFPRSEQFDINWSLSGLTVSADVALSPFSVLTADKLIEDGSNGVHRAIVGTAPSIGVWYAQSIYAKAGERSTLLILNATDNIGTYFNLLTGTVGTSSGTGTFGLIQSVGGGWYRCTSVWKALSSGASIGFYVSTGDGVSSYQGDGSSGLYVYGAQWQVGRRPGTYIATASLSNTNNFIVDDPSTLPQDWISNTSGLVGHLREGASTNLILQSQAFDNASWTKTNTTITADNTAAADGTTTADLISDTAVNATHDVIQSVTKAASSLTYALTVYAKYNTQAILYIEVANAASTAGAGAQFNIQTGSAAAVGTFGAGFTAGTSSIVTLANGWYRCQITLTTDTDTTAKVTLRSTSGAYLGTGAALYWLWGAQLEQAANPSSYIPTTTIAVARNDDVLTYAYAQDRLQGTMFAQFRSSQSALGVAGVYSSQDAADNSNNALFVYHDNTTARGQTASGGAATADVSVAATVTNLTKAAMGYVQDNVQVAVNGTLGTADVSAAMPLNAQTTVVIGRSRAGVASFPYFGVISRVAYWPKRLRDDQLQALTL